MAFQKQRAFTMVELLVVISIIGMLMALVLPAVLSQTGRANQITCTNNQRELGLALISYESARGRFPGYANVVRKPVSWSIAILPQLDRRDVYDSFVSGTPRTPTISLLVCPDDVQTNQTAPWTSYVANAGLPDVAYGSIDDYQRTAKADGIFNNLSGVGAPQIVNGPPAYVRRSDMYDGAATTLLLVENLAADVYQDEAGNWVTVDQAYVPEGLVGFLWTNEDVNRVNFPDPLVTKASSFNHARPSSRHTGGALVTFVDGHVSFLSDNVAGNVYSALCTPHGANALYPQTGIISESDLTK